MLHVRAVFKNYLCLETYFLIHQSRQILITMIAIYFMHSDFTWHCFICSIWLGNGVGNLSMLLLIALSKAYVASKTLLQENHSFVQIKYHTSFVFISCG